MSILARFKTIMSSNINAMLDKMEDPSKMIDQLLRDLNDDLGKVDDIVLPNRSTEEYDYD